MALIVGAGFVGVAVYGYAPNSPVWFSDPNDLSDNARQIFENMAQYATNEDLQTAIDNEVAGLSSPQPEQLSGSVTTTTGTVTVETKPTWANQVRFMIRPTGTIDFVSVEQVSETYVFTGLTANTSYDVKIQYINTTTFQQSVPFSTSFFTAAAPPSSITTTGITNNSASGDFTPTSLPSGYNLFVVEYKKDTDTDWLEVTGATYQVPISGLDANTLYNIRGAFRSTTLGYTTAFVAGVDFTTLP